MPIPWPCRSLAGLLSIAGLVGCSTEPTGCDVCTTSAVVYGHVLDTASYPVPHTLIFVNAYRDSCGAGKIVVTNASAITDTSGRYRALLKTPIAPFNACLALSATPPDVIPWGDTTISGALVEFRSDFRSEEPRDSVRVDLHLPPQ